MTLPSASAEPAPRFDAATVLQIPGVLAGPYGAAMYNPTVHHGHGSIFPTPVGYGYVYTWTNLFTGASGTITDRDPGRHEIHTGSGQVVVTGHYPGAQVASIGTFYVAG
ncbi:hypothetical protein [Rhodococcus sp. NPDC058514]|uniref:hypothetical protein n=1 Tax=unclassified Rhodococcus (in: high G+C Gram-positive bacteria) TaxID=192944 RepID=UPI00365259C8